MNMLINNLGVSKNKFADSGSIVVPYVEKEIDKLVYELYGLTEAGIRIVERKNLKILL